VEVSKSRAPGNLRARVPADGRLGRGLPAFPSAARRPGSGAPVGWCPQTQMTAFPASLMLRRWPVGGHILLSRLSYLASRSPSAPSGRRSASRVCIESRSPMLVWRSECPTLPLAICALRCMLLRCG